MPLDLIRRFFDRHLAVPDQTPASGASGDDPARRVQLAACALFLELAHADDEFSDDERRHLEEVLGRHFGLDQSTVAALIEAADAERQQAVDLYQFTSLITRHYDEGQRMVLAEIMWRLVFADGELSKHEQYLMRKLSSLLELRPGYLAEARKRAAAAD